MQYRRPDGKESVPYQGVSDQPETPRGTIEQRDQPHEFEIKAPPIISAPPPPIVADPIPVRIIESPMVPQQEKKAFQATQYNMSSADSAPFPREIIGARDTRRRLRIRNLGPDTVFLGSDRSVNSATGFPLPTGQEQELETTEQVYANLATDAAHTAQLGIVDEFTIPYRVVKP